MSLSNSAEYQPTSASLLLLSNQTDYEEGVLYNSNDQGTTFAEFVDSNPVKMFLTTLWTILAILGIFGNGLVIFIAIAYKKLNDITNCYIFNLAITDLLFIIFCIPFTSYLLMNFTWPFGEAFCKINHFMSHASVQSTCLTLTAMTIHRCRLIIKNKIQSQCKPKIKKRQKTVLLITIFIWITSFLISSPDLFHFTVEQLPNSTELVCKLPTTGKYKFSELYMKAHHFISIATTYVIPLLIIILSYARLLSHITANQKNLAKFRKAKTTTNGASENIVLLENQQQQKNESRPQQQQRNDSIKPLADNKRRKVTKMVALVTLNFGICWLPTHLLIIVYRSISVDTLYAYHPYFVSFKYFAHTLSYLTPVVNPCVYAFYNENFRTSLFDILRRVFYNRPPWLANKNGNLNDSLNNKNKHHHNHHHHHHKQAGDTTKPTTTANSNKDVYVI